MAEKVIRKTKDTKQFNDIYVFLKEEKGLSNKRVRKIQMNYIFSATKAVYSWAIIQKMMKDVECEKGDESMSLGSLNDTKTRYCERNFREVL